MKALHAADVPIIILDPLTDFSHLRDILPSNPNAILVINSIVGPTTAQRTLRNLHQLTGGRSFHTVFVNIEQALASLDILRGNSSSADAVRSYQDSFFASNVSSFVKILEDTLKHDPILLRIANGQSLVKHSLTLYQDGLKDAQREIVNVRSKVNGLRTRMLEKREDIRRGVLAGQGVGSIGSLLGSAEKELGVALGAMSWWKLPTNVDELTQIVSKTVETSSLRDLETQVRHRLFS